jgi:RNA polymerase sigma-70 factor (ECF subfamily)
LSSDQTQKQFLALLEPVHDRLARYALVVTKNREDAEDLINDTLLAAYEQFDKLREPDKFLHLLLRIASRLWMRRRPRLRRSVELTIEHSDKHTIEPTAEAQAELRLAIDALETISPKLRETILLFDVLDLSHEEIRIIQGGTLSGVKSRIRRGRAELSKKLGVEDDVISSRAVERNQAQAVRYLIPTGYAE